MTQHRLRLIAIFMALVMTVVSLPLERARAAFVPTDDARGRLSALLAREDVQFELRRLGVNPAEAAARVAALSDREIAERAEQFSELAAGQQNNAFVDGLLIGWVAGFIVLPILLLAILLVEDAIDSLRLNWYRPRRRRGLRPSPMRRSPSWRKATASCAYT